MAKKKVPKKAKRRLLVFGPIAVFIIVYCAITLVTTGMNLYKLKTEEKEQSPTDPGDPGMPDPGRGDHSSVCHVPEPGERVRDEGKQAAG